MKDLYDATVKNYIIHMSIIVIKQEMKLTIKEFSIADIQFSTKLFVIEPIGEASPI